MSGKTSRQARRSAAKAVQEYGLKAEEIRDRAIEGWLTNVIQQPLKIRAKVAWHIFRGRKR